VQSFDLIVLGSGPAGQRAAIQAAKLGKSAAIIEKGRAVGGVCTNTGTVPSKTLREAVLELSGLRQRAMYGGAYRGKHDITANDLLFRCDHVIRRERDVIKVQLQRNGVRLFEGIGRFYDPHTVTVEDGVNTHRLEAPNIVIAVGTTPSLPPGIIVDHRVVLSSDDILSLQRLPRSMTVVGAGVIGLEYATVFAALGIEVTLVDKRTEILDMVDREVVDTLTYLARNRGVTLRLGEEVIAVEPGRSDQGILVMKSGKRFATEMILVSAGRQGATIALDLQNAGLQCDERGRLVVNRRHQTSVPHIYAVGDVIGFPSLASTSAEQGRMAACEIFGEPVSPLASQFPYGIFSVPEIGWVGANEAELTAKEVPFETGVARYKEIARGQILGDAEGLLKLIFHLETRRILGVWVLGSQATELVHIGQAVMAFNGTLDYFINTVFNYPTLAECYKVAALDGMNKLRGLEMWSDV
jgi:NAD(P) transhydrogenase